MYFLIVRHTINLPGAKIRARSHIQAEGATENSDREREVTLDLYLFSTEAQGAHTNTIFSLVFFFILARIHYLFFDGALFTFLLSQLGNFSCYIKVLSQMVSPTPTSTASSTATIYHQGVRRYSMAARRLSRLHVLCLKKNL